MSDRETAKRPKLKVISEGPFNNLVRILYDILDRGNSKPTRVDLANDLKTFGISTESQWGPSLNTAWRKIKEEKRLLVKTKLEVTNFERARLIAEAEANRRKEIAKSTLEKIKANRPSESVDGSPMGDLGSVGSRGRKILRKPDSDGEYKK